MDTQNTAGRGHNNPPLIDDATLVRVQDRVNAANVWLGSVKEITDADTAKACDDFLGQLKSELKAVDEDRQAKVRPHLDAQKAINAAFETPKALLDTAIRLLNPLKTAWLKREQDRIAAEKKAAEDEALRQLQAAEDLKRQSGTSVEATVAADQAQKQADAAVVQAHNLSKQKATVKGDYATRASSLRSYWSADIVDYPKALQHYANHPEVRAVIEKLANADARTHKDALAVPGLRAIEDKRAA